MATASASIRARTFHGVEVDGARVGGDLGGVLVVRDSQGDGRALDTGAGCVLLPLDERVV